jgi:hypothetical protein
VLLVPATTDVGEKAFVTTAPVWTVMEPEMAAALVAPRVLVTPPAPIVLVTAPLNGTVFALRATTSTLIVQLPAAGMLPAESETLVAPAAAVTEPPHELARLGVGAICSCAGKLSVKATPVSAMVLA